MLHDDALAEDFGLEEDVSFFVRRDSAALAAEWRVSNVRLPESVHLNSRTKRKEAHLNHLKQPRMNLGPRPYPGRNRVQLRGVLVEGA